jgi:Uma2 family endonuclease
LQPDIFVILNAKRQKLQKTFLDDPPDLAIEIASPGTAGFDRREKQDSYARFGVPEYWIADAGARTVEVLVLDEGHYRSPGVFSGKQTLPSRVVSYFPVPVEQFFV